MSKGNASLWSDQFETFTRAWTDTQKKMWENWYDLARTAPPPLFQPDLIGQWPKLAAQDFAAWTAKSGPTAKSVAEHLITTQKTFVHLLEFLTSAWQAMAAKIASGEEWQYILKTYAEQMRQQLLQSPEKTTRLTQDLGELWLLYVAEMNKLTQPWLRSSQLAEGHLGQAIIGNGSALIDLTNLYWDAYERSFGRLLESPSMGYTRELNEKVLKGFDIWRDFRQASFEYQVVLADTWVKAFVQVMEKLASLAEQGQPIKSLRELAMLWNDVADPVFIEAFRSEKFIHIQGRLLSTAMTFRIHQREISELFFKMTDIPTRTEVDEAHQKIYEQRKELKALKKALAEITTTPSKELDEARRNIEELRQEVKAFKEALAALTTAPSPPPQTPTPTKTASKPLAKGKQVAASQAVKASSKQEGGEHANVTNSD
jgi:class III poly(R)-hydroxyalkanoic acid synthase PhaE subunit